MYKQLFFILLFLQMKTFYFNLRATTMYSKQLAKLTQSILNNILKYSEINLSTWKIFLKKDKDAAEYSMVLALYNSRNIP